jgi:hypothetical protein
MDFVERLFGISPDGGSGAFEGLILVLAMAAPLLLVRRHSPARQRGGLAAKLHARSTSPKPPR